MTSVNEKDVTLCSNESVVVFAQSIFNILMTYKFFMNYLSKPIYQSSMMYIYFISTLLKLNDMSNTLYFNVCRVSLFRSLNFISALHVISSQEVFPWVRNLNAEISLFSTEKKKDRSTFLKLFDTDLMESHLTIDGLNVEINNVYLGHSIVYVSNRPYYEGEKYVNVSNSTIGHLSISDGFQITISNCFIDGRTRLSETLIRVTNCILTIQDSMFYNFKSYYNSPAILKAMFSIVYIQDIFCSNNVGSVGLIQILNGSQLYLSNSDFEDSGKIFTLSTISLEFHSSASLFNSTFVSNSAVDVAALNCYFNTSIEVRKSGF